MTIPRIAVPLVVVLALGFSGFGPQAATAQARRVVETADSGSTRAELSYDETKDRYGSLQFDNVRVLVTRAGSVLVDDAVPRRCGVYCGPANRYREADSIHLRDLNRDSEPDVIVDLYTGGAHCCFLALVYGFNSKTGSYERGTKLLNEPYRVRDLDHDGLLEFRGVDGRFDYRFDCYACSRDPIQIWRFRQVPRHHPSLLDADQARRT